MGHTHQTESTPYSFPMQTWKRFSRVILFLTLLTSLLAGVSAPAWVDQSVSAAPMSANALDVVISEVAWGGTATNSVDEWIELYNPTAASINLSGWTFASNDLSPNILLTGTIPANGYYLLEADDDSTISDITADQIYTGSLNNSGETLTLRDNSSNIIDTANNDSGPWNAGTGSPTYFSMERIVPIVADSALAWFPNNGVIRNGKDANNNPINGTPRNSKIDLSLTMTVDNPAPSVGSNIVFTITLTNNGIYNATNVSVNNVLSAAGLTYVSDTGGGTYVSGTGIWTIGALAPGTATLSITAQVTASGVKTNRAEIWTVDQFDPDSTPGNSITTEDDYALQKATAPVATALNITNTVNNQNPNVGTNVVFTVTVNNPLTSLYSATNVQVAALLPLGLTYVSYSSTLGTYNGSSGMWTISSLAIGASATLNVTATVISSGIKTYVADVSSDEYVNSAASSSVTPGAGEADLSLSHDATLISTSVADQVGLKIRLHNAGPFKATNVQVRDLLPAGLTFVSYTSTVGTYNSTTGIWALNEIAMGADAILTINVKVDSAGTSTKNFAEVWLSDQYDPNSIPGNGETSELDDTSFEVPIADLRLTETVDIAGASAVFTISVSNAGPDDATGVNVKTSLPALTSAYTFSSYGSTLGIYDNNTGIWTVGALADGASATLTITTTISGSLLVNWVEVSASGQVDPDSVPGNTSRTEDDDASAPSADLFVTQSVNNVNPDIGANVVFTSTVGNAGIAGTTNVQVKDLLPAGLTYVSYTSSTGTYTSSTGIWAVGALPNGASQTLNITAKVAANGILTNWAEVWKSDESDPDSTPGNNSTIEDDDASASITTDRSIIINEVAWAGTVASTSDEWIELYNPSSASINISGWTLKSASNSLNITLAGTIKSGEYFLLERDNNFTVSDVTADQIYTGGLSDDGEILILSDGSANVIDTANNENGGTWPRGSKSSPYGSMERQGTSSDIDKNWVTNVGNPKNGLDANSGAIYGTPRKVNSAGVSIAATPTISVIVATFIPAAGRPVINEFLPRPGFDWNQDGKVDVFDEFIEIKNIGNAEINISGWILDDEANLGSNPFILPALTLKVGERAIFYGLQTNILLSDGGDTVRLINPGGKIFDAYTYPISKVEDKSVCRLPDGNGSWYEDCVPTPNRTNTREGVVPAMPDGGVFEAPVCERPETRPADCLFAECRGYGANIWHSFYWDEFGWQGDQRVPANTSKWESFVE